MDKSQQNKTRALILEDEGKTRYWACSHCHWILPYDTDTYAPSLNIIYLFRQHVCHEHGPQSEQQQTRESQKKAS
jgi:hypothetical protein